MRKLARASLRIAVALIVAAAACVIAAVFVFRSGWFHERVRERIVSEIGRATGARAELGAFSFDWKRLTAVAGPVILHGREGPGETPLASIQSVRVGLRVISMLERRVDLASLRLDRPVIHIIFYSDGSTNIPPPTHANWAGDLLNLAVRRYEADDGLIEYDNRKFPLNLRGEDLRAAMSYEARAARYRGEIESHRVRAMIAGYAPVEVSASAQFAFDKSRIQVSQLRLASQQSRADLAGILDNPRSPHGSLSVKASVSVREAADLFQLPLARAGTASFDGQLAVSLSDFAINGRLAARGLGYSAGRLRIEGAELSSTLRLTPDRLTLTGLRVAAMGATLAGSADLPGWRRFHFDGNLGGLRVRDAVGVLTTRAIPWSGVLDGGVSVDATLNGRDARVRTAVAITPAAGGTPIDGTINALYDQAAGKLRFENSRVATPASSVDFSGTLGETFQVSAQTSSVDDLMPAIAMAGYEELPAKIAFAHAAFRGTVTGPIGDPLLNGEASLTGGSIDGHAFDRFEGKIEASRQAVRARDAVLARGPTEIAGSAELVPPVAGGALTARLRIANANLAELGKEAKVDVAVAGIAGGTVQLSGSLQAPQADVAMQVEKPAALGEQIDRLSARFHYSPDAIRVASLDLEGASGTAHLQGAYEHRAGDWKTAEVRFDGSARGILVSAIKDFAALQSGVDARVDASGAGSARIAHGAFELTSLRGEATARNATWSGRSLGGISLTAETRGSELALRASAQVREIKVDAQGSWKLDGSDPGSAAIRFSRANLATLHALLVPNSGDLPFEGFVDGVSATVSVALRNPREFQADLTIPSVQLNPKPTQTLRLGVQAQDLVLRNSKPVAISISAAGARVTSAQFSGRDTSLEASGAIPFGRSGADLTVRGSVNLAILQLLNPDLVARGNATVQAAVRGSLQNPQVNGRMELKNASLYLSDLPNGVDNANGALVFDRNRATIEKLTAETGGGTVNFAGFVGFGQPLVYRLQAVAQNVRVRYPQDVSVTFNATVALNGTSDASTVSGVVTLNRASFTPRADLSQVLAQAGKPGAAPGASSEYVRGMQFDVRVESGPNFELQTSLTRNLEAEIDLRLRGTPLRPALLGTFSVNEGEAEVFGNRYTVNRGDIRFVNPVAIDPIFDIDLETKARGVTVNIAISGTLQKLNVNYSSDPPMQPREIIALLAVGRAPADTLGLNPEQSTTASSSLAEAGGGLIGQAITAQLSSRLQRFFGASRVKIDPTLSGIDYLPQARLTIEQQVSKDITLTYITNLNRTQEQIVQVEWDFSKQWSAVAVREANGLFGIDFQYKKRFK